MGWEGGVCCAWHDLLWLYLIFLQLNTPLIPSSKQYAYIGGMKWDWWQTKQSTQETESAILGSFHRNRKKMLLSMLRSFKKKNWENMVLKCSIKECKTQHWLYTNSIYFIGKMQQNIMAYCFNVLSKKMMKNFLSSLFVTVLLHPSSANSVLILLM